MVRAAVVLAAGQGKRMKSDLPKVLHTIAGVPMVRYVIDAVRDAGIERVIVVVGYQGDRVVEACADAGVEFVRQEEQLGTGHAVIQAEPFLDGFEGTVIVLNGDVPALRAATLRAFISHHESSGALATVLTARLDDPSGYGRIVRGEGGELERIVEDGDATDREREIDEINSGLFCFDARELFSVLRTTNRENVQNEYYVTDAIEKIRERGLRVAAWCVEDSREVAGVNTAHELDSVREFIGEKRK